MRPTRSLHEQLTGSTPLRTFPDEGAPPLTTYRTIPCNLILNDHWDPFEPDYAPLYAELAHVFTLLSKEGNLVVESYREGSANPEIARIAEMMRELGARLGSADTHHATFKYAGRHWPS